MYLGTHSLGHAYKEKWKRFFSRASVPGRNERALFKREPFGQRQGVSSPDDAPDAPCSLLDKRPREGVGILVTATCAC